MLRTQPSTRLRYQHKQLQNFWRAPRIKSAKEQGCFEINTMATLQFGVLKAEFIKLNVNEHSVVWRGDLNFERRFRRCNGSSQTRQCMCRFEVEKVCW
jgi:hypothetical protein